MAAYGSYPILLRSLPEEESGVEDDFSDSGILHSRVFHGLVYERFDVIHSMTMAEWTAYRDAYRADRRAVYTGFTFYDESPQRTLSVQHIAPPQVVENLGLGRVIVQAQLRSTGS